MGKNSKRAINLDEWPEPKNKINPGKRQGHGHPFDIETKPFISNAKEMKRKDNLSLTEALKWVQKFRDKAIAKSTKKAYKKAWKKFKNWARSKDLGYKLPIRSSTYQIYLAYLAKSKLSIETVRIASNAIKHKHRREGISFKTSQIEKDLLKGIDRVLRKPKKKAYAIKKKEVLKILKHLLPNDFHKKRNFHDRVVDWREATFLAMSFFLLARYADLAKLTTKNLTFTEDGITVQFGELKNNKEGEFKKGLITKNPEGFCLVEFIKSYLKRLKQAEEDVGVRVHLTEQPDWQGPLFPQMVKFQKIWHPCRFEKPVCYSTVLNRLKNSAKVCGIEGYSLHSGRRGGATELVKGAAEKGIDFAERLLQIGGRGYINEISKQAS